MIHWTDNFGKKNGFAVLLDCSVHDYFPKFEPLWKSHPSSHDSIIAGPFRGLQRIENESYQCETIPFGELPWQTKLGNIVTSLAIISRKFTTSLF